MLEPTHGFDPQPQHPQPILRLFGPLVMGLGIVMAVVGILNFFSSLRSLEPPTYLWCTMVGLPLLGIGASLAKFGRDETILRDLAEVVSPEARASLVMKSNAASPDVDSVQHGQSTVMCGDGLADSQTNLCGRCLAANPVAAKFCNQCGASLRSQTCSGCGASITPTARFCMGCGKLVG